MAMQAPTKTSQIDPPGVRPQGALHAPTTTYVSSTRLDSEHSGAPTPIFSSRPTKCNFQHPDPRVLGSERSGARPRSFDHSDCDASSPPTRICSARGARGLDDYLLYKTMGSHSRADAHDAGPTSLLKRPLIREDLNVIQISVLGG